MKKFKKICEILNTIIVVLLILLAAVMIVPKFAGGMNLAVLSGSMAPGIPVGSMVTVKKVDPDTLKEGDVITFRISETTLVTHRIVSIDQEQKQLITKGDANDVEDPTPVAFENVVGKEIFHLPYLGYLIMNIKTPLGIAGICGVVMVLILLNYLPDVLEKKDEKND